MINLVPLKLGFFFLLLRPKPQGKGQADLEAECLLSESKNLPKAIHLAIEKGSNPDLLSNASFLARVVLFPRLWYPEVN